MLQKGCNFPRILQCVFFNQSGNVNFVEIGALENRGKDFMKIICMPIDGLNGK